MLDQHFSVSHAASGGEEPLTLAEVKAHSRISSTDEDGLLTSLIAAARGYTERRTRRQIILRGLDLHLDDFPAGRIPITLPRPPLRSVNQIRYVTDDGSTTIATTNLVIDADSEPGRVSMIDGQVWPTPRDVMNAVTITYTAGYAQASDVPQELKQAMLLLVAHWYEHREAVGLGIVSKPIEFTYDALTGSYHFGDIY